MKRIVLILTLSSLVVLSGSCLKGNDECKDKTIQSEQAQISAYAISNGVAATVHPSGLQYQIVNQGTGAPLTMNSVVSVKYVGKFLNGVIFDQATTATPWIPLNNVIAGWQIGVPLIQKGGSIKLIIPSSLAYGCVGKPGIGPNEILYFEVELVDVM